MEEWTFKPQGEAGRCEAVVEFTSSTAEVLDAAESASTCIPYYINGWITQQTCSP
jgi:hypothetical protein